MKRSVRAERFTKLVLEVFRFWSSLHRHGRALTEPFGQTPARWQVLGGVWEEPRTVPQIARRMGLTRQSVQRVANELVDEGLTSFVANPDHERSPFLTLTERGLDVIQGIDLAQAKWSNQIAQGLDLEELETSVRTLRTVGEILDQTQP